MHDLYGYRPSANRKGVDSGKIALAKFKKPVTAGSTDINAASVQRPALIEIELNEVVDPKSSGKVFSEAAIKSPIVDDPPVDQEDEFEYSDENQMFIRPVDPKSSEKEFSEATIKSPFVDDPPVDQEDEFEEQMSIRPLSSRKGIFVMRSLVTSPDTIQEGIDDLSSTEKLADGTATEEIQKEKENEIEESEKEEKAEAEDESEKQKRKKRKQSFEDNAREILQSFDAKRAEIIKKLQECQKKVQAQGICELDQAMQKNVLLIIQAFAMAQNSAQKPSQCNCKQNLQPHCSNFQNPSPQCSTTQNQPPQTSSYQNTPQFNFFQEAGAQIGVPPCFLYPPNPFWFSGQTSAAYCAPPFVANLQNLNYLGQSMPGGFNIPFMPYVPNFSFFPGQMTETVRSSEMLPNTYNQNPFDEGSNITVLDVNILPQVEQSVESLQENPVENLQENPTQESTNSPQCAVDAFLLEENPEENLQENPAEESTHSL